MENRAALSKKEFAERLGVSLDSVNRMIKKGENPSGQLRASGTDPGKRANSSLGVGLPMNKQTKSELIIRCQPDKIERAVCRAFARCREWGEFWRIEVDPKKATKRKR